MMDEFKTHVISFDKTKSSSDVAKETVTEVKEQKPSVRNVLFNVTTKVPVVEESLPVTQVKTVPTQKIDVRPAEKINQNSKALPKFYLQELHRYARLFWMWIAITIAVIGLETWALIAIIRSSVSNWSILTLIPAAGLSIAFLIVYGNNYFNFRNEAKNADFSKEKLVTVNVTKLYRRLKTAHINVNWFCVLAYVIGGLTILITYLIAWGNTFTWEGGPKWGILLDSRYNCGPAFLITVIVAIAIMFIAFFMHIFLLVTNYVRASKIDQFYGVQIVSNEELDLLKKKKMKTDAIIFAAIVMIVVLIGFLIYRAIKNKKVNNTVTINNK